MAAPEMCAVPIRSARPLAHFQVHRQRDRDQGAADERAISIADAAKTDCFPMQFQQCRQGDDRYHQQHQCRQRRRIKCEWVCCCRAVVAAALGFRTAWKRRRMWYRSHARPEVHGRRFCGKKVLGDVVTDHAVIPPVQGRLFKPPPGLPGRANVLKIGGGGWLVGSLAHKHSDLAEWCLPGGRAWTVEAGAMDKKNPSAEITYGRASVESASSFGPKGIKTKVSWGEKFADQSFCRCNRDIARGGARNLCDRAHSQSDPPDRRAVRRIHRVLPGRRRMPGAAAGRLS